MKRLIQVFLFFAAFGLIACSDEGSENDLQTEFGTTERPAELIVPSSYSKDTPIPLLLVIHGYAVDGARQLSFSQLGEVEALIIAPDGTFNDESVRFWNATDFCCDFYGSGVDDVTYLKNIIKDIQSEYNVDPKRIHIWGHSNGGNMAYRMACEMASDIASVVSLAAMSFANASDCSPSEPVSVLHIHGDADDVIKYTGGDIAPPYGFISPSAEVSLGNWAGYNGCANTRTILSEELDLDTELSGSETEVSRYDSCPTGIDVEHWRMRGGGHIPTFQTGVGERFWTWLKAHPKP